MVMRMDDHGDVYKWVIMDIVGNSIAHALYTRMVVHTRVECKCLEMVGLSGSNGLVCVFSLTPCTIRCCALVAHLLLLCVLRYTLW